MDDFWYVFKIIIVVIMVVYSIASLRRLIKIRKFYSRLRNAHSITSKVKVGDYVKFSGVLRLPAQESPCGKKSCGYWGIVIRALFKTKAKKPGKGWQKHRPIIYSAESNAMPILVSNNTQLVHLAMENPLRFMINLKSKKRSTLTPPIEEAKLLQKSKYKSYETTEYWLPFEPTLHIWGVVADVGKNCVSISNSSNKKLPVLIQYGDDKKMLTNMTNRLMILKFLLVYTIAVVIYMLKLETFELPESFMYMSGILAVILAIALYRKSEIAFVK